MPVFKCNSCGRLLFRPQEMLGNAWQCLTCGPTTVSAQPAMVSAEMAALLEREYQLSLAIPPVILTGSPAAGTRPSNKMPATGKGSTASSRRQGLAIVAAMIVVSCAIAVAIGAITGWFGDQPFLRPEGHFGWGGWLAWAVTMLCVVLTTFVAVGVTVLYLGHRTKRPRDRASPLSQIPGAISGNDVAQLRKTIKRTRRVSLRTIVVVLAVVLLVVLLFEYDVYTAKNLNVLAIRLVLEFLGGVAAFPLFSLLVLIVSKIFRRLAAIRQERVLQALDTSLHAGLHENRPSVVGSQAISPGPEAKAATRLGDQLTDERKRSGDAEK